jgi:hypothetical protein
MAGLGDMMLQQNQHYAPLGAAVSKQSAVQPEGHSHQQLPQEVGDRAGPQLTSTDPDNGSDGSLAAWRGGQSRSWVEPMAEYTHHHDVGEGDLTGHHPHVGTSTDVNSQRQQQRWHQRLSDISTQHSRQEQVGRMCNVHSCTFDRNGKGRVAVYLEWLVDSESQLRCCHLILCCVMAHGCRTM